MAAPINLLSLFIILTLHTSLAVGYNKPNPPAFLLSLIKDKATYLYYTNLNLGNNNHSPLTHSLAVDLGGGSSVLLRCNTAVKSTTYLPIRCDSAKCKQAKLDSFCFNKTTTCGKYVSTSFTEHPLNTLLGLDSVSLLILKRNGVTKTVHSSLTLTCTNDANALKLMPEVVNGTIGLGKSLISLPSQLASMHKTPRKFAFCLPSKPTGLGSLLIGEGSPYTNDVFKNLASTPLIVDRSSGRYFIDVKSIEIAGKNVSLDKKSRGNAMICTLAPYTILQTSTYKAMVREFVREAKLLRVAKVKPFEACFNSKGMESAAAVPVIDLVVNGGAKWRINRWNSLLKVKRDVVCLAFFDGGVNMKTTEMVIGGFQMEDHLVEFDLEASKFTFSSSLLLRNTTCTQNMIL
ncbi:PREDICTED: aspartyl protease AED1-like [Camelina sativa]|uniref:Aspartyl protease AED1-like n=1 Tax=Camelina sativa TaxID=90675 RepID=A0ABM0VI95_CAMSA|nr:PREDICTED: aspartyl protease AED1-like [Camelina sativa]